MTRDLRFGVVFTGSCTADAWERFAKRLEDDGFDTLLVADHHTNPMACGPLIAAAAAATTSLRVGSYVYNNDFRHPALLAKEAATLDVLSRGRVELGIGAGWYKPEYDAIGLSFDPPKVRLDRFEEAIEVIAALLAGGEVSHDGPHYQVRGLPGSPLPLQPRVPLLIGGGGSRMVRLAARKADIIGLVPRSLPEGGLDRSDLGPEAMDEKVDLFQSAVTAAGRTDGGPERSVLLFGLHSSAEEVGLDDWVPAEVVHSSPYVLVGEPSKIADTILERRERWGLSYYVCFERDVDKLAGVINAVS